MQRRLFVMLVVAALLITVLAPGTAVAAEEPVGDQIHLVAGEPTTFPADTPFHVIHGFTLFPDESPAIGNWGFRLDIDGVSQGRGSLLNFGPGSEFPMARLWLYNYENGLPQGVHELTGHFYLPCSYAVDFGLFSGSCDQPNKPVEVFTFPLTVTFT